MAALCAILAMSLDSFLVKGAHKRAAEEKSVDRNANKHHKRDSSSSSSSFSARSPAVPARNAEPMDLDKAEADDDDAELDSDSDSGQQRSSSPATHGKHVFRDKWYSDHDPNRTWLTYDENAQGMFCRICQAANESATPKLKWVHRGCLGSEPLKKIAHGD